jgi:predicted ATPase
MLKKLTIRNFKAIEDMTIEFSPLTVLIGGNGCGKSTVLQALDFLRSIATQDISVFLAQREWTFLELKTQFSNGSEKPIELKTDWEFTIKDKKEQVYWSFSVDQINEKWIIDEKITCGNTELVYNNRDKIYRPTNLGQLSIQSSLLKIMGFMKDEVFSCLQRFLYASENFDLLLPDKMRMPSKTSTHSIGRHGLTLASAVHSMSPQKREGLNKIVSELIGVNVNVEILKDPSFGLIYLGISEYNNETTHILAQHMSDGLLRIIAFAAISLEAEDVFIGIENGQFLITKSGERILDGQERAVQNGMMLLDEIEDGINPYLTEKIINLLQAVVRDTGRQIIITTHSPIVLDYIEPDDIVFLWKDETGASHCGKMFATEKMRYPLNALSPGEIWVNLEKEQILERMGVN